LGCSDHRGISVLLCRPRHAESRTSARCCGSLRRGACCRPSTFVPGLLQSQNFDTTALRRTFTHTLRHRFGGESFARPALVCHQHGLQRAAVSECALMFLAGTLHVCSYADIIVHRLLAASIGADATYPDLVSKEKTADLCENINFRHTMAQRASRASNDLCVASPPASLHVFPYPNPSLLILVRVVLAASPVTLSLSLSLGLRSVSSLDLNSACSSGGLECAVHLTKGSTVLCRYCHILFTDKIVDEEGYVLRTRRNALTVLVPRYGIEGNVYFSEPGKEAEADVK
jgi:hypothetical protein